MAAEDDRHAEGDQEHGSEDTEREVPESSASSRKTIPATTQNTPVASADRFVRASGMLDPHSTFAQVPCADPLA